MPEVISLHLGQCGINIGTAFWAAILGEHRLGLDLRPQPDAVGREQPQQQQPRDELQRASSFFDETSSGTWVPRAVFCDVDSCRSFQTLQRGPLREMLALCAHTIATTGGTVPDGTFAGSMYGDSEERVTLLMERVRRMAERCDRVSGLQVTHALSGGLGSGFAMKLMSELSCTYQTATLVTQTVFSTPKTEDNAHAVYNTVLALHQLIEYPHLVGLVDNEALLDLCMRGLRLERPTLAQMNAFPAAVMSDLSSGYRFGAPQAFDYGHLTSTLVPFPRLHFVNQAFGPTFAPPTGGIAASTAASTSTPSAEALAASPWAQLTAADAIRHTLDERNALYCMQYRPHSVLASATVVRGPRVGTAEVLRAMTALTRQRGAAWMDWLPRAPFSGVVRTPQCGLPLHATSLHNCAAFQDSLRVLVERFTAQFRRRTHVSHYCMHGMDDMEFAEAESNVNDLVSELESGSYSSQGYPGCDEDDEDDADGEDF